MTAQELKKFMLLENLSDKAIARGVGVGRATVSVWLETGVPFSYVGAVLRLAEGVDGL